MRTFILTLAAMFIAASLIGCASTSKHRRDVTAPANVLLQQERIVLPMRRIHAMAVVDGPPVQDEPSFMIIDTGSSMAFFSDRVLSAYGRKSDHTTSTTDASGYVGRDHSLVHIEAYTLGPITFETFDAGRLEPTGLRRYLGDAFDGALGMSLFRDLLLTLDYPNNQVIIQRGVLEPGAGVLPAHFPVDGPPQVEIQIGDRTVHAFIDSGFEGSLELPRSLADSVGWQTRDRPAYFQNLYTPSAKTRGRLTVDLRIAGHVITTPRVLATDDGSAITIGSHVLQQFAVTLDARSKRIRFQPR